MKKYQNKYRIKSTRLPYWDYRNEAAYYITICTQNYQPFFGAINHGSMTLSLSGKIADRHWQAIPRHYDHVKLDAYIIMPNHIHGIVILDYPVETRHVTSLPIGHATNSFGPLLPGSLSKIIQAYKSSVTKKVRQTININFAWQPRFYEHIIRNEHSCLNIAEYIVRNRINWKNDENKLEFENTKNQSKYNEQ